jgi:cell division protein FtsB
MFLYNFVKKHSITKPLFVGYFVALSVICYFGFCIVFGSKGLLEYAVLRKQIANKASIKQNLLSRTQVKQNMIDGMNLSSLDIDLLDEEARRVLGYAGKNEVVVYQDKKSPTNKFSK